MRATVKHDRTREKKEARRCSSARVALGESARHVTEQANDGEAAPTPVAETRVPNETEVELEEEQEDQFTEGEGTNEREKKNSEEVGQLLARLQRARQWQAAERDHSHSAQSAKRGSQECTATS